MLSRLLRIAAGLAAAALASGSPASPAQGRQKPEVCPWCRNDPALMQAAGVVSHGPIAIGPRGSEAIAAELAAPEWTFLETAHLRWAFGLGSSAVEPRDKELLARLRRALPDVPEKPPKTLDRWLRLHLLAMRGEELYARFQGLCGVTDADFPEARRADGPYMGNGRFLGEKEKYEVAIHPTADAHKAFTVEFTGATVQDSLRWHSPDKHSLLASIPAETSDLKEDLLLFGHVAHNLSHLFLCGYKHFSYDPPVWLDEGLALFLETEAEPRSYTREGEEGSLVEAKGPKDWDEAARKLAASSKAPTLAELWHVNEPGELDLERQIAARSIVSFLIEEHGAAFDGYLGDVKGQLDAAGYPSGANLADLQRSSLDARLGWTPQELDAAWRAWARGPAAPEGGR
jgi:hypothetical protein